MALTHDDMQWFHIILTTYGAWLPGDPRGFRTRHHRDHVEGDYQSPPPSGIYEGLHRSTQQSLSGVARTFTVAQRQIVADWIWERLTGLGSLVAILAVAARHVHLLAKLPQESTRHWIGLCKKHITFSLREQKGQQKVWAGGAKFVRVQNRQQQLNVYRYIADHEGQGAYVRKYKRCEGGPADAVGGL